MPYIDPIELLQLSVPRDGDLRPEDIRRAKRKLQAEFEISGKVTLPYRDGEIDRSTAMRAVEQLEDPAQRAQYIRMHRHPALREFLRTPEVRLLARMPASESFGDAAFIHFIREQLAPIYLDLLSIQVRRKEWVAAALLLNRLDLLDVWQHEEVLKPFINYIRLCERQLTAAKDSTAETSTDLWEEPMFDMRMIIAMNHLPEHFQAQRNQYAILLIQLAVKVFQQKQQGPLLHLAMVAAVKLKVDHATQHYVRRVRAWIWKELYGIDNLPNEVFNYRQELIALYEEEQAREREKRKLRGRKGGKGLWAIYLVIALIALAWWWFTRPSAATPHVPQPFAFKVQKTDSGRQAELIRYHQHASKHGGRSLFRITMWQDLFLYELLNDQPALEACNGDFQLQDGCSPYTDILPPPRPPWDALRAWEPLRLVNRSPHGVVLFFEPAPSSLVLHHYYVGPGSQFLLPKLPTATYTVRAYHGLSMGKACAHHLGKTIPAFAQSASKISLVQDEPGHDLPEVLRFSHFRAFHTAGTSAPPRKLIFDEGFSLQTSE
jgi:hypothetical protein